MTDGNLMTPDEQVVTPNPMAEEGQQAAANNLSQGEGVPTQSPPPGSDIPMDVVRIVNTKMVGNKVIVTAESESTERLMSIDAKNLAYAQRFRYGMTHAGIEAISGMFVAPGEAELAQKEDRPVRLWQREFRLTPGI